MNKLYLLFLAITTALAQGTAKEDLVQLDIIGYKFPWYSGYLEVSSISAFHYVFFPSQHDPTNDPLLLWLNGGPGCSSMIGMVNQIGPFVFKQKSTQFIANQYAWNKKANLLFIQSPGQVGFSLGSTKNSDQSTANDNLKALRSFFSKFPNYLSNDFYLSGESYAGVYVPTLAYKIHVQNKNPTTALKIKMKGFIVGNPCTDPQQCYQPGKEGTSLFQYQFLYKHAFYTTQQYTFMKAACTLGYDSDNCKTIRAGMDKAFANTRTDIYNIYLQCYVGDYKKDLKWYKNITPRIIGGLGCDDDVGSRDFFNNKSVRHFLHVSMGNAFVWDSCNGEVYMNYQSDPQASYGYYHILMRQGYRIWVYSGDVDAAVPITGTINWLHKLRFDFNVPIEQPWREWWSLGIHKYEDQVGGMVWKLQNLTFASVKNAGHEVPRYQPELAYTLIDNYLAGNDLPQKQFDSLEDW